MTVEIKDVESQLRLLTAYEIFINGLQSLIVNIATSVYNAVRRYRTIKIFLEGQVTLANGERMVEPLGKNSRPGIFAILYEDYRKASLDIFCTMLLELRQWEQLNR